MRDVSDEPSTHAVATANSRVEEPFRGGGVLDLLDRWAPDDNLLDRFVPTNHSKQPVRSVMF